MSGWLTLPAACTVFCRLVTACDRPAHSWLSGAGAEDVHDPSPEARPWVNWLAPPWRTGWRMPFTPTSISPTSPCASDTGHPALVTLAAEDAHPAPIDTSSGVPAGVPPPFGHDHGAFCAVFDDDASETSSSCAPPEVSKVPMPSACAFCSAESTVARADPPEICVPKTLIDRPVADALAPNVDDEANAGAAPPKTAGTPVTATPAPASTPMAAARSVRDARRGRDAVRRMEPEARIGRSINSPPEPGTSSAPRPSGCCCGSGLPYLTGGRQQSCGVEGSRRRGRPAVSGRRGRTDDPSPFPRGARKPLERPRFSQKSPKDRKVGSGRTFFRCENGG